MPGVLFLSFALLCIPLWGWGRPLSRGLQRDVVYLVYKSPNAGGWGAVHITWHGAQINFGDLTPYLTYASDLVNLVCLGHDHAVPLDNHSIRVDTALK
jgi:hypothetical protein